MTENLFVDVGNLNVMMMVGGKFCVSMSYADCPEKLSQDAQALGSAFDVFLCMWPRTAEEGDVEIESLGCGSIPFFALRDEVFAAYNLVSQIPGVHTVYLCNALASMLLPARVRDYQTVLCRGSKYIYVDVQGKNPTSMTVYENQQKFFDDFGSDFTCYGDLDLVDVDKVRAQYPELMKIKRSVLVPLTPLIESFKCNIKVPFETAKEEILNYVAPELREPEPEVEEPAPVVTEVPVVETNYEHKVHGKIDWISVLFCVVICVCAALLGVSYQFRNLGVQADSYTSAAQTYVSAKEYNEYIKSIYDTSMDMAGKVADIVSYAKATELPISLTGIDAYNDRIIVQCNCSSAEVKDQFVYYIERKYTVTGVNEYGNIVNTDGTMTYEYGLVLLYS